MKKQCQNKYSFICQFIASFQTTLERAANMMAIRNFAALPANENQNLHYTGHSETVPTMSEHAAGQFRI